MKKFRPYPFQERVANLLLSGNNVLLQAPTGSGKTRAALLPFFHAWREETDEHFPGKCIYVVPMRVLAHQFVLEARDIAKSYERRFRRSLDVRIQTGDQPEDKRFESDLIFCTVDQFLSSYLMMPYSLSRRMANLNAGAMIGTYLVFDEFHLFDPDSTLPSILYVLKQLGQLAPMLIMTATFSGTMLNSLAQTLGAEVVSVLKEEMHMIETRSEQVAPRKRIWHTDGSLLTPEGILTKHQQRSLVLCNTVKKAQKLFRELRDLIIERRLDIRLMLLHSRFLPEDRRHIEDELRMVFGKDSSDTGRYIVVATQAIEVGVDITCEILHTELAPASALIQRAGRCARYPAEQGQVIVYPVESYKPYGQEARDSQKESLWVQEMRVAFTWLQARSGEAFDFEKEQAFVNAVASARDEKILMELSAGRLIRAEEIQTVLSGEVSPGVQRVLVRDVDSRFVLIHPQPDRLLTNPFNATGFNIQCSTLYGMLRDWLERDADINWRVKRLVEDKYPDSNEDNRTEYGWKTLDDSSLVSTTRVLVVNPGLAGYSREEGFIFDKGDTDFQSTIPQMPAEELAWERPAYKLESYEDHIRRVLGAFQSLVLPELQFPSQVLERAAGWPAGRLIHAAWLVCLLHDVGKLTKDWQAWVRAYQREIGQPVPSSFAAAHTEWDGDNPVHREAEKRIRGKHPKPHHAGEGALATSKMVAQVLETKDLVKAALTAITRHHSPFAGECQPFSMESYAKDHIRATIDLLPNGIRQKVNVDLLKQEVLAPPHSFSTLLVTPGEVFGWLAYAVLARALRRADQKGTAEGVVH